jgi:hypothetical protein
VNRRIVTAITQILALDFYYPAAVRAWPGNFIYRLAFFNFTDCISRRLIRVAPALQAVIRIWVCALYYIAAAEFTSHLQIPQIINVHSKRLIGTAIKNPFKDFIISTPNRKRTVQTFRL